MVNSQMNNNLAAVRRKLDRVRQQVEKDLFQFIGIEQVFL